MTDPTMPQVLPELSFDGLRYAAQDFERLQDLSVLNVDDLVN